MKRFLTCSPTHFGVNYEINPWMKDQIGMVDKKLAMEQWQYLMYILQNIPGVSRFFEIKQEHTTPDMVFTANAGLVIGKLVYLSNFFHSERHAEKAIFKRFFQKHTFAIVDLPNDITFEGAGDALFDNLGNLFLGYGFRSSDEVAYYFQGIVSKEIYPLELIDPHFYHLDTCFCPLSKDYNTRDYLYYPGAFSPTALRYIDSLNSHWNFYPNLIPVSEEDALNFACNAINVDEYVILNRASQGLKDQLSLRGYKVVETPLTEFIKAGGSAKCLTLEI